MKRCLIALACLLCVLAVAQTMLAQTATTGQIIGVVKDPTGAVVPSAKLTLTSGAGQVRETTSDAQGGYRFVLLPPGNYNLGVQAPGFQRLTLEYVNVAVTQTTDLELALTVAAAKEAVSVTAAPPLVDTTNATTGHVISETQISQLALPTRNIQQILTLSPGTVANLSNNTEMGRGDANISVNGQRMTSNSVLMDGTQIISPGTNSTPNISVPAPDAIQEFIVQTSLYDATQGRNSGGNVAVVTKSGTNALHGDVYEFFRNRVLNANDYFLKQKGIEKPILNRNQFGATLGGPIVKDKTFFFVSYQGTRERNGTSMTSSMSSANIPAGLTNDRSDTGINTLGAGLGLTTLLGLPSTWCTPVYCPLINTTTRQLLQAKLPTGQWAIPSAAGTAATPATLVNTPLSGLSRFREDQFSVNIDQNLGQKNKLSGKFFFSDTPQYQAIYSFIASNPWEVPGYGGNIDFHNRVLTLSDTHVFTSNLINQARFGFSRINGPSTPEEPFKGTASNPVFGINNPMCNVNPAFCGMPTIGVTNSFTIGSYGLADQRSVTETFEYSDMLSYTHGRHFLRFGGEVQRYHADFNFNFYSRGQISFYNWQTFMMGVPLLGLSGNGVRDRGMRVTDFAWYFQDDMKVTSNLTLNLGVRVGRNGGIKDIRNRLENFDQAAYAAKCVMNMPCAPPNGLYQVSDSLNPADWNVAPRFGFSWKPLPTNNGFVVRGGFGVYFDRFSTRVANLQIFNYPYDVLGYIFGAPLGPGTFANPFPDLSHFTFPLTPTIPSPVTYRMGALTLPVPISGLYVNPNFRTPYVYQYNLGVQQEIAKDLLLEVGYVGSKGTKLINVVNLNQGANGTAPYGIYNFSNNKVGTPFQRADTSGISHFDSLQASLTKRFGNGLQFLASYTWSKSIDDGSGTPTNELAAPPGDEQNRAAQRAVSDFYRPHRFVLSGLYDLPKFYRGDVGLAKQVVNGWELSGVFTMQSGAPFSVLCTSGNTTYNYADLVSGADPVLGGSVDSRLAGYFDRTGFKTSCANAAPYGTSSRNFLRGPSGRGVDLSIAKFFPITETKKIEFRSEFFNVFNFVNFANPINSFSSADPASFAQLGKVVATATGPRIIQFALKFSF